MFVIIQFLFTFFILVTSATYFTEENMQEESFFMDSDTKIAVAHTLLRYKRSKADIVRRLENCCNIKMKNKNEQKEKEAVEQGYNCWNYVYEKVGGKENYNTSKVRASGVKACLMLCTDEKLGLLDSKKKIKKDAALKYILDMYETENGKALARENFFFCLKNMKEYHYKVVQDGSVTCSEGFRGIKSCINYFITIFCPDEEQIDDEDCEDAREELAQLNN